MNERVKKLWIDALLSGNFPQGKGQLECDGKYCCLGVLEWLAFQEGVIRVFDGTRSYLSIAVKQWAELDDTNPNLDMSPGNSAGWLNDDEGYTFPMIAQRIEQYL